MKRRPKAAVTLYHATDKENVFYIIAEGLKTGIDGYIYFCKNPDDALAYAYMYNKTRRQVAVIPIEFTEEEFNSMELNADNAPGETPDAYRYGAPIPKQRIPRLRKIPLYTIW